MIFLQRNQWFFSFFKEQRNIKIYSTQDWGIFYKYLFNFLQFNGNAFQVYSQECYLILLIFIKWIINWGFPTIALLMKLKFFVCASRIWSKHLSTSLERASYEISAKEYYWRRPSKSNTQTWNSSRSVLAFTFVL